MLRMVAFILALGLYTVALATSQPPSSSPGPETNSSHKDAEGRQGVSGQSAVINNPVHPQDGNDKTSADGDKKEDGAFSGWSVGDKIAAIVAAIGFCQFLALLFTYCIMRDTSRRQLKAYVSANTKMILDTKGEWIEDWYGVQMENYGQTPAYKVRAISRIGVFAIPLKKPLALGQRPASESATLLFPKEPRMIPKKYVFSPKKLAAIDAKTHAAYFWGRIEYEDAFKKRRWTTFCFFMDKKARSVQRWAHYPTGNDADRGNNKPLF